MERTQRSPQQVVQAAITSSLHAITAMAGEVRMPMLKLEHVDRTAAAGYCFFTLIRPVRWQGTLTPGWVSLSRRKFECEPGRAAI
jgi:hypothetical protein